MLTQSRPTQRASAKCEEPPMRGVLLWALGIPIPVVILLYLFNVI